MRWQKYLLRIYTVVSEKTNSLKTVFAELDKISIPEPTQSVDLTTKVIGEFGLWQLKICFLMILIKLPNAWYQLNIIFMAPPQDFWCAKPINVNCSEEEWREICSPMILEHQCLIYDPDIIGIFPYMDKRVVRLVSCKKFAYNDTIFKRTITSDWDLVCKNHWLVHFTQIVIMWGILVGTIVFGILSDKYGRRLPLLWAIIIQVIFSCLLCFVNNFGYFLFHWFVLAFAAGGVGAIPFVVSMEVVSGKYRTVVPVLYQLPFGIGIAIMAGLAYWLRDWRKLELALGLISSVFILYCFVIPESPRWLLAKGQTQKALKILENAAQVNKRKYDPAVVQELLLEYDKNGKKDPGFKAFLKAPRMRMKTIMLSLNWFCTGLSFYTFSQYMGSMANDIFLSVSLTGLVSTSGGLLCLFVINKIDRKTTIASFEFVTGICFVLILLIPKNAFSNDWIRLLFAGIGFAGMAGSIPALYLFTGELFPTLGRNVGISGVTTFARVASMAAPAIVYLDTVIENLPMILLTIMAFGQILLLFPLPETQGKPLPDTLEQAEDL